MLLIQIKHLLLVFIYNFYKIFDIFLINCYILSYKENISKKRKNSVLYNKKKLEKRLFFIDFLRMLALFHMYINHLNVALSNFITEIPILTTLNNVIPICPALFLFVSGFTFRYHNNNFKRKLFRIISLFFIAIIFFIAEHGFQYPDFLFAPGILFTIGLFQITVLLSLKFTKKNSTVAFIFIALLAVFFTTEITGTKIFPFNNAYEPLLPTIIFGFTGYFISFISLENTNRNRNIHLLILFISISAIIIISFNYGIIDSLASDTGRNTIIRNFNLDYHILRLFIDYNYEYTAKIWNYNFLSFFSSLFIVLILFETMLFTYFLQLRTKITNSMNDLLTFLLLPGRHTLLLYVSHLLFISVLFMIDIDDFLNAYTTVLILTFMYIFSYILPLVSVLILKFRKNHQGITPD